MALREFADRYRGVTVGLSIGAVLLAVVVMLMRLASHRQPTLPAGIQAFYSDDNGKTWFADDATKVPPFDHNGKPAYRAIVYRCGEGAAFVSCLESFPPEVKSRIEQAGDSNLLALQNAEFAALSDMLIKPPGATEWMKHTPANDAKFMQMITSPKCPDGSATTPTIVTP